MQDKKALIRALNDSFRSTFISGRVLITASVQALAEDIRSKALLAVREFNDFNEDNDPHREHDFGSFDLANQKFFWKIDLYEEPGVKSSVGSPFVTRVLTIMLAEEY